MSKRAKDVEEVKKRKIARLRFRNLIRSVSINRIWLVDTGEQKLTLNVKKNIAMLVRTKRKIGLLTMMEKSLIRTHYTLRTIEEKKKLVSLMAGLNCFSKISPKIRARLSKCVKFMVIGNGRKLIHEGDNPMMLYFILTGEVEVSKKVFDHIQNCWVDRIEKICGPGDCLGDVELIEKCVRRHTYTTTNVVELLVVFEEDFERILRPVMEQQWSEKKCAIMALDYFNFFTRDQVTNACKLCVLKQFEPLETIYYEDKGQLSYVYFVISGECMILQCLKMLVRKKSGNKSFELIDTSEEDSNFIFQDHSNNHVNVLKDKENFSSKLEYDIDINITSDDNVQQSYKSRNYKLMDLKNMETKCGLAETSKSDAEVLPNQENGSHDGIGGNINSENMSKIIQKNSLDKTSILPQSISNENTDLNVNKINGKNRASLKHIKTNSEQLTLQNLHESLREPFQSPEKCAVADIENHFIDVGSLTFGGIFGLGEKIEHRVIMARTTVQCLMIPRFWLLEKDQNPGNIWQRRKFYLDTTIPSRKMLFKDFINTRQWQKFKMNLIQSHLNTNLKSNPTRVEDIPIICRIVEARDD